jgi:hypothetical protein
MFFLRVLARTRLVRLAIAEDNAEDLGGERRTEVPDFPERHD